MNNITLQDMEERLKNRLTEQVSSPISWNEPLSSHTSFGIGGPADALVRVQDGDELHSLLRFVCENDLSWRVLGAGTNLLVRDEGYRGIAIVLEGALAEYSFREDGESILVEAGGGCRLSRILSASVERGYTGLEFGVGIPGTIGGAVVMNAGAWGGSMENVLERVDIYTDSGRSAYSREQLGFGYRKTTIPAPSYVVGFACFRLERGDSAVIRKRCSDYRKQRLERQPAEGGNAGSVFRNPQGDSAGRLIEASGLKGLSVGGAKVSAKHANFIVNCGGATAADVLCLIETIQQKVEHDSGIRLQPEVHIL